MKKLKGFLITAGVLLISASIYGYITNQVSLILLLIVSLSSVLLIYGQLSSQ